MEKFGESEIQQSSPNLQKKLKSICKTNWTEEQEIPPSFHVQIGEIKKKDFRQQYWTAKEDQIYLQFLEDQGYKLRYKSSRKGKQIFSLLSEKMGKKRTAAQCKSHHQKMKKATQNGTIKEIIAHVKARHWSKSFDIKKLQIPEMCAEDEKPAKKKVGKYTEVKIILDVGSIAIW